MVTTDAPEIMDPPDQVGPLAVVVDQDKREFPVTMRKMVRKDTQDPRDHAEIQDPVEIQDRTTVTTRVQEVPAESVTLDRQAGQATMDKEDHQVFVELLEEQVATQDIAHAQEGLVSEGLQ